MIYINSNNLTIINNDFVGIISENNTNGHYLHISNTIHTIEELKNIKISSYDLVTIDNTLCNDKIIN